MKIFLLAFILVFIVFFSMAINISIFEYFDIYSYFFVIILPMLSFIYVFDIKSILKMISNFIDTELNQKNRDDLILKLNTLTKIYIYLFGISILFAGAFAFMPVEKVSTVHESIRSDIVNDISGSSLILTSSTFTTNFT